MADDDIRSLLESAASGETPPADAPSTPPELMPETPPSTEPAADTRSRDELGRFTQQVERSRRQAAAHPPR